MAENLDAQTEDNKQQASQIAVADREEIYAALLRMRRLAECLPQVDAAAIVREGRELTERETR